MVQDRIDLMSPLAGLHMDLASPLGREILAQSQLAQRVDVQSQMGMQIRVVSATVLEVLS